MGFADVFPLAKEHIFEILAVIYSWKEFSPPSQGPSGRPYEGLGWDP